MMSNLQHHFAFRHPDQELEVPDFFPSSSTIDCSEACNSQASGQELLTWLPVFRRQHWAALAIVGLPQDCSEQSSSKHMFLVADALKANDSVFREVAKIVHYRSQSQSSQADAADAGESKNATVALQVHCLIHQVSLTRRTLVLGSKAIGAASYVWTFVRVTELSSDASMLPW